MHRLARSFVSSDASAEEVVQDTWVAVLQGIDGFQERSTLRTWVYRILVNTARKRGVRESRTVPWTSLQPSGEDLEPSVDPAAFRGADDPYPGHWRPQSGPTPWHSATSTPSTESSVLTHEVRAELRAALSSLPDRQRIVVTLRDVLGHTSDEVCEMLDVSAANQRVLLHRGRARLREILDDYLAADPARREPRHV
jgi:RNA polymerase sigma-70 factor, ECF subfamily